MDISKLPDRFSVEIRSLGAVELKLLTMSDLSALEEALRAHPDDSDLLKRVFEIVWLPSNTPEAPGDLPVEAMNQVVAMWAAHRHGLERPLEAESLPRGLRDALKEYLDSFSFDLPAGLTGAVRAMQRQQQEIRRLVGLLDTTQWLRNLSAAEEHWTAVNSWVDQIRITTPDIHPMLGVMAHTSSLADQISSAYSGLLPRQDFLPDLVLANEAVSGILDLQRSMAGFHNSLAIDRMLTGLDGFSREVETLWGAWAETPDVLSELTVSLRRAPVVDLYVQTASAAIVSGEPHEGDAPDLVQDQMVLAEESLPTLLASLNPDLIPPYRGALDAVRGDSLDQVRHFSISVRELLSYVLRELSPDEAVRVWTSDPKDYHNGRPTRGARLRYIFRHVATGEFQSFVEADIRQALDLFDLLQKGTHRLQAPIDPGQTRFLLRRVECLLLILLESDSG